MAAAAAAQQSAAAAASASKGATAEEDDDEMPELEAAEEEAGPADEGDLDPNEIEMVMEQVCIVPFFVAALCSPVVSDGMHQDESRYRTQGEWWRSNQCQYVTTYTLPPVLC